jgi:crotonobetainyl-CoA:carnitine CoA-transferase CaiB-like acyl-CoA transferase
LSALHQARRTGIGQHVDVSMLGVMSMMVAGEPFDLMERCGVPQRTGLTVPRLSPFGIYRTSDGFISICAYTERFAQLLFGVIGRPELCSDPKFATRDQRVVHVRELDSIIEEYTSRVTSAEAVAAIESAGVPAAEIRTPGEAVHDPRTLARADTVRLTHPKYGDVEDVYGMGMPIKFSEATAGFDQPAPRMGEHNDAIYGGLLGYSQDRIQDLRRRGVI